MYDNLFATSTPSDIHLISSSSAAMQQQLYGQLFGSLADVIGRPPVQCRGAAWNQQQQLDHQLHEQRKQFASSRHHQQRPRAELRSTRPSQQKRLELEQAEQQQQQQQQYNSSCQAALQQHYLTIEELKTTRNSCWLCGCNWQQDHVSLDCPECDGYALSRPCPSCDGKCKQIWQRNISATHDKHRALWTGQCAFEAPKQQQQQQSSAPSTSCTDTTSTTSTTNTTGDFQRLVAPSASSVCSSQPSSAASSDDEEDDFLSF